MTNAKPIRRIAIFGTGVKARRVQGDEELFGQV
jgi:hypothetical protein